MRTTIVLLISLVSILAVSQAKDKLKGEVCKDQNDCVTDLRCVEGYCDCKLGHMPEFESHGQGGDTNPEDNGVYICRKVVGTVCNNHEECNKHMDNARCDVQKCVCNKEDGCTDGAMTLAVMSLTTMMAVVIGVIRIW